MTIANNPYQLYKLLPGDNCRQCYLPSCMAFAAAVIRGEKAPSACPRLEREVLERLEGELIPRRSLADEQQERIEELRGEIAVLDFAALAPRLGGRLVGDKLVFCCLGKDFTVDRQGRLSSECHVNPWLQLPLLRYLLVCRGELPGDEWVPLAALAGGAAAAPLFGKRCEEPLRALADKHGEDFFESLALFGHQEEEAAEGERVFTFRPLPLVPFRLAYQPPEEGLDSSLRLTFERSAEQNAVPEMLYFLGAGFAAMLGKILQRC
ncbi:MAG: DUF3786 domain-containing protein [Desulfurivibrio sp.]|nr:DUF3786 domain-containing protein [Desulfurivibrio sp.]